MKNNEQKTIEDIHEMVKDIRFAMLCTHQDNGHIHSRPMGTQGLDENGNVWFFAAKNSPKIAEINKNPKACVCYAEPSDNTYVCLMGNAYEVYNKQKIDEYWNPAVKVWFPEGKDDPNLTLIKVEVMSAEYWDSASNKVIVAFNMIKALVTGQEYDEGENGVVTFK